MVTDRKLIVCISKIAFSRRVQYLKMFKSQKHSKLNEKLRIKGSDLLAFREFSSFVTFRGLALHSIKNNASAKWRIISNKLANLKKVLNLFKLFEVLFSVESNINLVAKS